jgi:hypothetical protein
MMSLPAMAGMAHIINETSIGNSRLDGEKFRSRNEIERRFGGMEMIGLFSTTMSFR